MVNILVRVRPQFVEQTLPVETSVSGSPHAPCPRNSQLYTPMANDFCVTILANCRVQWNWILLTKLPELTATALCLHHNILLHRGNLVRCQTAARLHVLFSPCFLCPPAVTWYQAAWHSRRHPTHLHCWQLTLKLHPDTLCDLSRAVQHSSRLFGTVPGRAGDRRTARPNLQDDAQLNVPSALCRTARMSGTWLQLSSSWASRSRRTGRLAGLQSQAVGGACRAQGLSCSWATQAQPCGEWV